MKIILSLLCLLLPASIAVAQTPDTTGMDMQKMMVLMQQMQECMAKVDQTLLADLEKKGEAFSKEVEELCARGERKKAQKKAIAFSKKMMKHPTILQMKECSKITKGLIPDEMVPSIDEEFDYSETQVCDR